MFKHDSEIKLMRVLMTAVHQQFVHILALRQSGDELRANRIYDVDRLDFVTVLRMTDELVRDRVDFDFPTRIPRPGNILTGLLQSELAMETEITAILEANSSSSQHFQSARLARQGYVDWLSRELNEQSAVVTRRKIFIPAGDLCFSLLITIVEQSLIHAFVFWYENRTDLADAAWATSGTAMLEITKLTRAYSIHGAMPEAQPIAALRLAQRTDDALSFDNDLAAQCYSQILSSKHTEVPDDIMLTIQSSTQFFKMTAAWCGDGKHPAFDMCTKAFHDFGKTRDKFLTLALT